MYFFGREINVIFFPLKSNYPVLLLLGSFKIYRTVFGSKKVAILFLVSGKWGEGLVIMFTWSIEVGAIHFSSRVRFAPFLQMIALSEDLCHRMGTDGWTNHVCSILNISLL